MKSGAYGLAVAVLSCLVVCSSAIGQTPSQTAPGDQKETKTWGFDADQEGALPKGFVSQASGRPPEGKWEVKADPSAPTKPNVLAQTSSDKENGRFPILIAEDGVYEDIELSVRFKAVSGKIDQAGGLVFRFRDSGNYYITRANALEDNVRLYRMVDNKRQQFASADLKVTPNEWHTLKVEAKGSKIEVYYDGQKVIEATDDTYKSGKIGLWTKADSVTYFDDLTVESNPHKNP